MNREDLGSLYMEISRWSPSIHAFSLKKKKKKKKQQLIEERFRNVEVNRARAHWIPFNNAERRSTNSIVSASDCERWIHFTGSASPRGPPLWIWIANATRFGGSRWILFSVTYVHWRNGIGDGRNLLLSVVKDVGREESRLSENTYLTFALWREREQERETERRGEVNKVSRYGIPRPSRVLFHVYVCLNTRDTHINSCTRALGRLLLASDRISDRRDSITKCDFYTRLCTVALSPLLSFSIVSIPFRSDFSSIIVNTRSCTWTRNVRWLDFRSIDPWEGATPLSIVEDSRNSQTPESYLSLFLLFFSFFSLSLCQCIGSPRPS